MSPKKPVKGTTRANNPGIHDATQPGGIRNATPQVADATDFHLRPASGAAALEATGSSPVVITQATSTFADIRAQRSTLERYLLPHPEHLPPANNDGLRIYRGREYVDTTQGGVVMVSADTQTGLHRARLAAERHASGPSMLRDTDSGLWHSLNDGDAVASFDPSLQALRTDLDFTDAKADADGLFRHDGRLYLSIHNNAYQAMHDAGASTATQKAWRIVNPQDPVASDIANIYRASRSGETRAVRRGEGDTWVYHLPVLKESIADAKLAGLSDDVLLQMNEPFQKAHRELDNSTALCDELAAQALKLPHGSSEKNAKLLALEVQLLKLTHKQADFVESLLVHRQWLVLLKAGGLFKQELHTFRLDRVNAINRLIATMDLRTRPEISNLDAESCKKLIPFLSKKLRLLQERDVVMAEIRKADPGSAPLLEELRQEGLPPERLNFSRLTLFVHLYAGTPDHSPNMTMPSLASIDLVIGDLKNAPQRDQPMALLLALDQIRTDKTRFEKQLGDVDASRKGYIREILNLIDPIEKRVENRLSDMLDSFDRNNEMPSIDHDIDFDFLPPQPDPSENARPVPRRQIFRVRQHGTYRVLIGDMETGQDGNVIVKVPDPLRPESPSARYEKRQGEWQPVRPPIVATPRPQLVAEAQRLLAGVDQHIAKASVDEARNINPTEIVEDLDTASGALNEQARRLHNHENANEDAEIVDLITRLHIAAQSLASRGQSTLVRMYKNRDVLDIMRLNYLIEANELSVSKTVERKPLGKGTKKSFLDVYSIRDRADDTPLWEAHFHYDQQHSQPLNFNIRGGHLKTLEQSRRGIESQRRDELAGLPHVAIWRQTFDGKTATKLFALSGDAASAPQ